MDFDPQAPHTWVSSRKTLIRIDCPKSGQVWVDPARIDIVKGCDEFPNGTVFVVGGYEQFVAVSVDKVLELLGKPTK